MKFLKGLGVFILTLVLFLATTSILILIPVRHAVSKDTIKETITSIDIEKLMNENPQVQEDVTEAFKPLYDKANEYGISEDVVNKILNSKEVKGMMGDFTGNIVDYVLTGENQKIISNTEIENLVSNALDKVDESGFYEFKDDEKDNILDTVKETVNKYQDLIPDTSIFDEAIKETPEVESIIKVTKFILNDNILIYLIIAIVVSILGILGLKFKEGKWIKSSTITVLVSATITTLGTIALLILKDLVFDDMSLITNIINKSLNYSLRLSLTTLIVMVIILIIYIIVHRNIYKDKKEVTE